MKKWKDRYKKVISKWNSDKWYSLLNDVKIKDENIHNLFKIDECFNNYLNINYY